MKKIIQIFIMLLILPASSIIEAASAQDLLDLLTTIDNAGSGRGASKAVTTPVTSKNIGGDNTFVPFPEDDDDDNELDADAWWEAIEEEYTVTLQKLINQNRSYLTLKDQHFDLNGFEIATKDNKQKSINLLRSYYYPESRSAFPDDASSNNPFAGGDDDDDDGWLVRLGSMIPEGFGDSGMPY